MEFDSYIFLIFEWRIVGHPPGEGRGNPLDARNAKSAFPANYNVKHFIVEFYYFLVHFQH